MPAKPPRNFLAYAAIEALCILLVPGAVILLVPPNYPTETFALGFAAITCAGFLLVGAAYWAGLSQWLTRSDRTRLRRALALADRLELPLLCLAGTASISLIVAIFDRGWSKPVVGAMALTLLALLEYINYYHRQLQHFDRWNDFKRLLTSGRFPQAHMARDLARYREE